MAEKDHNFNYIGPITDKDDPNYGRTKCSVMTRSMGFYRPTSNFNTGKYQEYKDRKMFSEQLSLSAGNKHLELMKCTVNQ